MEILTFGHAGLPALVFPTSCGRFFEFEDQGMVAAVRDKIEAGRLQLFCVDSVDAESWYNRDVPARWRIARQMQYQHYILHEVVPYVRHGNDNALLAAIGCSLGAYHAANLAFRHPEIFTSVLALGGAFDLSSFLGGYYDEDCYFNLPTHYLRNLNDAWLLERYRKNVYVLAAGEHDICRGENERLAEILWAKGIPARLEIWGDGAMHDWPVWRRMLQVYV